MHLTACRFENGPGSLAVVVTDRDDVRLFPVEHLDERRVLSGRAEVLVFRRSVEVGRTTRNRHELDIRQLWQRVEDLGGVSFETVTLPAGFSSAGERLTLPRTPLHCLPAQISSSIS